MTGFTDRRFWMLEGFGYANSEEMTAIHTSYNGSVTIDNTTIPGRSCANISAGGYIDIAIPRYDFYPWSDTLRTSGQFFVVQAKVYLDAASYTNQLANNFLLEIWAGLDQRFGVGLSANTSVAQDNWYIKSTDVSTDLAVMNPAYIPPAIPQRTVTDLKVIFYNDGANDGIMFVYVNNFLVTYTAYNYNDWDNIYLRNFRGIRLSGLANQSGPTLWSDLMVYTIARDYRTAIQYQLDALLNTGYINNSTLWGNSFVPMTARVFDITPTTTVGGITQFSTLGGGGNAITALSTLDTNSYVTSTAASQAFRLKVNSPDAATGDNSTAITVTDQSEVLAFQSRIYAKDVAGTSSNFFLTAGDESLTNYRFRYYKLRMCEMLENYTGGYINKVQFLDSTMTRMAFPVGATMRMNNVNASIAAEYSHDRQSNTTIHTNCLSSGGSSVEYYYWSLYLTGESVTWNRQNYVDYILDMGSGNVGPDWYALNVYQPGDYRAIFNNFSVYGSSDANTWYLLGDLINTDNAYANNLNAYIINRRHPAYVNGTWRNLSGNFQLNAAQFEQVALCYTGDPIAGGNLLKAPRTPVPWAQFKDYTIGFNEV